MKESFSSPTAGMVGNVRLTDGFWQEKQQLVREETVWSVYRRFEETGRFRAFRFEWKEGDADRPHIFWDSDIAKWIEAVAYLCEKQREPELEKIVDGLVEAIALHRMRDGYFNSCFEAIEPQNRFTRQGDHELYCAGHLIEASIAYRHATGKKEFLELMTDYADLIVRVFYEEKSAPYAVPGHEEIEMALLALYRETGKKTYLDCAAYFIEERGRNGGKRYAQEHLPVREQKTAEGHAVRACYFYCAVASLAKETRDEGLAEAARTLFHNITTRKMYLTGGIGQTCVGESFMGDWDLPLQTAYAETCANLSLAMFSERLTLLDAEPDAVYADVAERVWYNSFLSGLSLDGKSFFYSNPQEIDTRVRRRAFQPQQHVLFCPPPKRKEVFDCSCCPPNVARILASIEKHLVSTDGETVWVHQYASSDWTIGESSFSLSTGYPFETTVRIACSGAPKKLALRLPGWCENHSLSRNGEKIDAENRKGYLVFDVKDGDEVLLRLENPVRFVESDPRVWETAGRVGLTKGPLVYCLEGIDHPGISLRDIRLDPKAAYETKKGVIPGVPVLETKGFVRDWEEGVLYGKSRGLKPVTVRLIPYFAILNRGETDLVEWVLSL